MSNPKHSMEGAFPKRAQSAESSTIFRFSLWENCCVVHAPVELTFLRTFFRDGFVWRDFWDMKEFRGMSKKRKYHDLMGFVA